MKTRVEKTASIVGLMLGALGIVVGFQNCGVSGFEVISDLEKSSLLAKTSVFGVQGSETQSGNQGSGVNASIPVSNDDRTGAEFSVRYFCSTLGFTDQKRVVDVSEIYAEVTLGDTVVCDEKKNQFRDIVDRKKFKISQVCMAKLEKGRSYGVRLYEPSEYTKSIGTVGTAFAAARFPNQFRYDGEELKLISGNFSVLYDLNPQLSRSVEHDDCDDKASPLVALIGNGSKRIELTSPTEGIRFDILGQRAAPHAHAKKRISWFLNENHNYYFIALPNANGQVTGIDQLFGDNTMGPDGDFASNGYAALAKYDSNRDGFITAKDPIFSQLRMWQDLDLNGVSSPNELFTMEDLNIVAIDLRYDSSYKEVDAFGNEILMKSAIKTGDGRLHLLFDLWFRRLN